MTRKVNPASLHYPKHVEAAPGRLNKVPKQDILENEKKEEAGSKTPNGSLSYGSERIRSPQAVNV